jgi:hypothetical protein
VKSLVNCAAEIDGAEAEALELGEPELDGVPLLPHAETTSPAAAASENIRVFLDTRLK